MDVHMSCLIGETTLLFVGFFSTLEYLFFSFLHVALVDPMVHFYCAAPADPVMGATPEFTTYHRCEIYNTESAISWSATINNCVRLSGHVVPLSITTKWVSLLEMTSVWVPLEARHHMHTSD